MNWAKLLLILWIILGALESSVREFNKGEEGWSVAKLLIGAWWVWFVIAFV